MTRITSIAALALSVAVLTPPAALASGGPVPPVQGADIGVAGNPYRFVAAGAGADTVVKVVRMGAGPAVAALRVHGRYGIPGVDYNGSTTGLSANGRTLVLAGIPGNTPPRVTRLLVLDTPGLAVRGRIALPGFSTVDAISPNGRWLYLIHYPSSDTSKYEVRAYDLVAHRLLSKPVIDPRDRGEAMTGFPITRVMSAAGRWAYTLYARPSGEPFIHALDTVRRRAVCIDLPSLTDADIGNAHLQLGAGGALLQIDTGGVPPTRINTRTFAVRDGMPHSASTPTRPPASERPESAGGGDTPWELIALGLVALAVLAVVAGRRATRGDHPGGDPDIGSSRATRDGVKSSAK